MKKPPLRLVLGTRLQDGKARTAQDFCEELAAEYAGEGQISLVSLDNHLESMRCVGIVKIHESTHLGDEVMHSYVLTEYGQQKVNAYK